MFRYVLGCIAFLLLLPCAAHGQDLFKAAADQSDRYVQQLEELAKWCDGEGLSEQAVKTRAWLRRHDPNRIYVAVLPEPIGPPELPEGAPPKVAQWNERFWQLRRQQATALEALARRSVRADRASLAFSLILAAIRENPDHEGIRRILGYQKYQGGWHTLYEVNKLRAKQVRHPKFGWLPRDYVRRYEEGMRYSGKWITAAEDAKLHGDIQSGWDIETEHYSIRTDHSLEAGVALGDKLEQLYRVWKQLFVRYFASEAEVTELFGGKNRRTGPPGPKLQVVFFRDRNEYNEALRPAYPNIGISIGLFDESTRRAYFFAGKDYEDRTMYHEATHQLFHLSRPVAPNVGRQANFWIVEGVAMYMESLHEEDGFHVLGGLDDPRMVAARFRLLNDDFYVPLSELNGYGMQQLQTDKRIGTLYSQAAGLTHFLIHHDGGRYRDALVQYLQLVYTGRDNPQTLAQLTGVSLGELDTQYRKFIEAAGKPKMPEPDGGPAGGDRVN